MPSTVNSSRKRLEKFSLGRGSLLLYTRSLAPADFSGAVFTCAHFQKIAQISSLCDFLYISEDIPSLECSWLLMTFKVLRIWFMRILPDLKKRTSQGLGVARAVCSCKLQGWVAYTFECFARAYCS